MDFRQAWPPQRRRFALPWKAAQFATLGILLACGTMGVAQSASQKKNAAVAAANAETLAQIYKRSWEVLDKGAQSENVRKRTDAIAALASMEGDPKAIHLIENALDDRHADVRRIAASALGSMHAKDAISHLRQTTNDKDPGVSFAAAEALWKMGDPDGATIFYAVLLGNRQVSHGVIQSNIDSAWKEVHDPMALANIGIGEASGALLGPFAEGLTIAREMARDRSVSARALSATLLGQHPSPDSEKMLEDTLDDKSVVVRAAVAKALGGFNDPALIKRLAPLLEAKGTPVIKPVDAVRFMAAAAIIRLYTHGKPDSPIATPKAASTENSSICSAFVITLLPLSR